MMIRFLNPVYGNKIYDPCCGTGGFLLECFKYLREHTDIIINESDSDETKRIKSEQKENIKKRSIYGRELTSTARIAKMNMILFGDGHTNIEEMDCLSKVVEEKYDIVVSKSLIPKKLNKAHYMIFRPIRGIVCFFNIWKAVKKGGKIGVIVPDTFLYSKDTFLKGKKSLMNVVIWSLFHFQEEYLIHTHLQNQYDFCTKEMKFKRKIRPYFHVYN